MYWDSWEASQCHTGSAAVQVREESLLIRTAHQPRPKIMTNTTGIGVENLPSLLANVAFTPNVPAAFHSTRAYRIYVPSLVELGAIRLHNTASNVRIWLPTRI
jgi:hypothetical protein